MSKKINPREETPTGSVELLGTFGTEQDITDAARVSYGVQVKNRTRDENIRLLRYLMRHKHLSPFEMCEVKLLITCPMYVWRQWVRHRTANLNEVSGRYTVFTEADIHIFDKYEWRKAAPKVKQGSSLECLSDREGAKITKAFEKAKQEAFKAYQLALDSGVCREQARTILPLSTMTRVVWKIDLRNLLHFLELRYAPNAQKEIRDYALAVLRLVRDVYPNVFDAWDDYVRNAEVYSAAEIQALAMLAGCYPNGPWKESQIKLHWPDREGFLIPPTNPCSERDEFLEKLKRNGLMENAHVD